ASAPRKPALPGDPQGRSTCPWATSFHHLGIDRQRPRYAIGMLLGGSRGLNLRLPSEQPLEVSGIADPRVGFEAPHMLRDATPAEPDLDLILVDHDLHGLENVLIGCAISNGVDVYKAVGTDATLQAASANSQGACRQGPQGL